MKEMKEHIEEFLAIKKQRNYAQKTIKEYELILKYFTKFNSVNIYNYQKHILPLQPLTRYKYLRKLSHFLLIYKPELIKNIQYPKLPQYLPKEIPSQESLREILAKPDTATFAGIRDRCILEVFYSTGIRSSALRNLELEDIDFTKRFLRINQGKSKKDHLVPISQEALFWLKKYLNFVRPLVKAKVNYVFISNKGGKLLEYQPSYITKKYCNKTAHSFRHAFATHLLQNGMRISTVQRLLGHARLSTTQRYTKVVLSDLKKAYFKFHGRDLWRNQ